MSYAQALEMQMNLLRSLNDPRMPRFLARRFREAGESAEVALGGASSALSTMSLMLTMADPYYLSPDPARMLRQVGPSMPPWTLRREALPTLAGYLHLADQAEASDDLCDERHVVGISWCPVGKEDWTQSEDGLTRQIEVRASRRPEMVEAIWVLPWVRGIDIPLPLPGHLSQWTFGDTLDQGIARWQGEEGYHSPQLPVIRLLPAALAFMEQKLLVATPQEASRQTRKRADEVFKRQRRINVLDVRVRRDAHRFDDEPTKVEWSIRWGVSGHWRQQYYPTTNQHRPIWIAPYIKGPESKPLQIAARVLRVT